MNYIVLLIVLSAVFLIGFALAFYEAVHIGKLSRRNIMWGLAGLLLFLAILGLLYGLQLIGHTLASQITMILYTLVSGFFLGGGTLNLKKRLNAGTLKYVNHTFMSDVLPNIISTLFIAYGLYKTDLFSSIPLSGLSVTSGISLILLGFYGFTLKIVPEFREEGILLLDRFIHWKDVLSFEWQYEQILDIDYILPDRHISEFTTLVPLEDRKFVENLLNRKIEQHRPDSPIEEL